MQSLTSQPSRPFRAPQAIFWTALGLRLAVILIGHTYRIRVPIDHFGFGWEMGRIARSLTLGQGYANPFNGFSGPTAWAAPLYPLLMALSFKLFGIYTDKAAIFLLAVNSVFSAAVAPAVYEIAARCFDARGLARRTSKLAAPVAMWSAWMWAVYPAALQYAIHWLWEMSLSVCFFAWILVLAMRLRGIGDDADAAQPRARSAVLWAGTGVLWGLLTLSNSSLLPCFPAFALWCVWPQVIVLVRSLRADFFRKLVRACAGPLLAVMLFCGVMMPWWVRNERVFHTFVATRSNFGVELDESLMPEHGSFPYGTALPLWSGAPEFQSYVRMGEVPYAKMRGAHGVAVLRAHPGRFLHRTLDRFLFYWDGTPHPPDRHPAQEYFRNLSYAFLSVCGLLGLGLALRRRVPGAMLMLLAFVIVPLPYYVITAGPRFRHPLEPLIAILGVYLFRSATPRPRLMVDSDLHAGREAEA